MRGSPSFSQKVAKRPPCLPTQPASERASKQPSNTATQPPSHSGRGFLRNRNKVVDSTKWRTVATRVLHPAQIQEVSHDQNLVLKVASLTRVKKTRTVTHFCPGFGVYGVLGVTLQRHLQSTALRFGRPGWWRGASAIPCVSSWRRGSSKSIANDSRVTQTSNGAVKVTKILATKEFSCVNRHTLQTSRHLSQLKVTRGSHVAWLPASSPDKATYPFVSSH